MDRAPHDASTWAGAAPQGEAPAGQFGPPAALYTPNRRKRLPSSREVA